MAYMRTNWRRRSAPFKSKVGSNPIQLANQISLTNYLRLLRDLRPLGDDFYPVQMPERSYETFSNGQFEVDFDASTNTVWTYEIQRQRCLEVGWQDSPFNPTQEAAEAAIF